MAGVKNAFSNKGSSKLRDSDNSHEDKEAPKPRQSANLVAFLVTFGFVWLVFDNMALAFLFALVIAGGSEMAQRNAVQKPRDRDAP